MSRRPDPTPVERFVFHALSLVIVALDPRRARRAEVRAR